MRFIETMDQNRDTMAWGGVSAILGLSFGKVPAELQHQFIVIVVFPMLGWLGVYLLKNLVTYIEGLVKDLWGKWKKKSNTE